MLPRTARPRPAPGRDEAQSLFQKKLINLRKVVRFRAIRYGLTDDDVDEVLAEAYLALWQAILRGVTAIDCRVIALAAYDRWKRRRRRDQRLRLAADLHDADGEPCDLDDLVAAREPARLRVGGTVLTVDDAIEVAADQVELWIDGIGPAEAARRLNMTRQGVTAAADRLGGVRFNGGCLRFPASVGRG